MSQNKIQCAILGGEEKDLGILSELHRQERIQIAFVYERNRMAVGLEIAEILGLPRYYRPIDIEGIRGLDYVVVSEPRARFADELKALSESGAQILTPAGAIELLCGRDEEMPDAPAPVDTAAAYTIEDTLAALERLLDRAELLKFLLEVAVKATSSRAGSVMLYSPEAKELYIAYANGLSERVIKNTRQKLGEGVAGSVALNKQAQLIREPAEKTLYARDRERMDIGSAISVPLIWNGKLLGVLNVSTSRADPPHTEKDLGRLKALSRRLSRVLFESIKLQEVQVRHRESRFRTTMGEIAEKDISSREKFSVLAEYLTELMHADTVEIFMNTFEGDWLVLGGSSRLITPKRERVRYQSGALGRAFLERRCIVLTESVDPGADPLTPLSSAVYCHLSLKEFAGVIVLEFSQRDKLDEFLMAREAIVSEVARFSASEMRERKLRRELDAMGKISDAAAAILGCRSIDDLGNVLTRVVADVLECDRVSVRLRGSGQGDTMRASFLTVPGDSREKWLEEEERQFDRLAGTKKPYTIALLDFESTIHERPGSQHSLLASPIISEDRFFGGILAYSKRPVDPMEEAVFTELDQSIIEHLTRLVLAVLDGIHKQEPLSDTPRDVYDAQLGANLQRFAKLCDSEIARSNRYHHTFAIIVFDVQPLEDLFEEEPTSTMGLVEEITQGLQTRTRKTDYGCWIGRTRYAMLSLEAGRRIRFLISRAMLYLTKDLSAHAGTAIAAEEIQVGVATYPGTGRTADDLIREAGEDLKPHAQD